MTIAPETILALPLGQFRIYPQAVAAVPRDATATRIKLGELVLEVEAALPVKVFGLGPEGAAAVILGTAFDIHTRAPFAENLFVDIPVADDAWVEACLERLFGTFILIVRIGGRYYLYLDACGTLSAVYSKERGLAGATTAALLSLVDYRALFRRELYDKLDVANEGWFPSGMTAHAQVNRLLCNHRLDLQDMSVTRHWPCRPPLRSVDADAVLSEITAAARTNLEIVLDNQSAGFSLTGGSDSRSLLALSRARRDDVLAYTVDAKSANSDMDVELARKVAALAGVRHRILTMPETSAEAAERWRQRCGHCIGGNNARAHAALDGLSGVNAVVEGFGAEVAKGFFWRPGDNPERSINAQTICERFGMPLTPETLEATAQWLDGTPREDALLTLDLAYVELRMSAWAYAQSYAAPPLRHLSPLVSRKIFALIFTLPIEFKREAAFTTAIIRAEWPELLTITVNRYGDYRDAIHFLRRAANPRLVKKKLRKMMAR